MTSILSSQPSPLRAICSRSYLFQAWRQVVARHPILRTVFVWDGWERPLQIVLKNAPLRCQLLDWRSLNTDEQASQMTTFLADSQSAGLTLNERPPHHLTLIRLSERETRFIWTVHHIIIDGWTESLLYQELFSIYEALERGETARPTTTAIPLSSSSTGSNSGTKKPPGGFGKPT